MGAVALFRQLLLLQQKNFLLMWRRKLFFLIENVIALLILPLLIIAVHYMPEGNIIEPIDMSFDLQITRQTTRYETAIITISGNISETDFYAMKRQASFWYSIDVKNGSASQTVIFNEFDTAKRVADYRIEIHKSVENFWKYDDPYNGDGDGHGLFSGFNWTLQTTMDRLILNHFGTISPNEWKSVRLKTLHTPPMKQPPRLVTYLPEIFTFATALPMMFSARDILLEREAGVRVYMMSMGVSPMAEFLSNFINTSLRTTFTLIILAIPVVTLLSKTKIQILFFVWLLAQFFAGFAIMVAQLFNRALFVNIVLSLGTIVSTTLIFIRSPVTKPIPVLLNSLNPSSAFRYVIDDLLRYEAIGQSPRLFGLYPTTITWEFNAIVVLLETFLLLFIAACADQYLLRESSCGRFIIRVYHKLVRCCTKNKRTKKPDNNKKRSSKRLNCIEPEPDDDAIADIRVENLEKRWPNGELAVDDVSFNARRGNVTVLLGHNGAGKSTTFACLTGITPPTRGRILLCDKDISRFGNDCHAQVGYCPQNNPLFRNLTVYEHVRFFLRIRNSHGAGGKIVNRDKITEVLERVGLGGSINKYAQDLSGGMKRKLFVALAIVGDPRVVLLDEPTAGMDPGARQKIQKILIAEKRNRTVLLTTHYMDEADALGDRVVIMAGGKVVCNGSTDFLKKRFGTGYVLSISLVRLGPSITPLQAARDILACIQEQIPDARFNSEDDVNPMKSDHEFDIRLPFEDRKHFADMFAALEERQTELGVETFGISLNSLEQVFLKVNKSESDTANFANHAEANFASGINSSGGLGLFFEQFFFLCWRQILYAWRNKFRTFTPVLISLLIISAFFATKKILMALAVAKNTGNSDLPIHPSNLPNLRLPVFTPEKASQGWNNFTAKFERYAGDNLPGMTLLPINRAAADAHAILDAEYLRSPPYGFGVEELDDSLTLFYNPGINYGPDYAINILANVLLYAFNHTATGGGHGLIRGGAFKPAEKTRRIEEEKLPIDKPGPPNRDSVEVYVTMFSLIISIVLAIPLMNIVDERSNKFQHQIFLTKVTVFRYWLAQYAMDLLYYGIVCVYYVALFSKKVEMPTQCIVSLIPLMLCYFFSAMSLNYLLSFLFRSPTAAVVGAWCWHEILPGIVGPMIALSMLFINEILDLEDPKNTMEGIFSFLFPSFAFKTALMSLLNRCWGEANFFTLYSFSHTLENSSVGLQIVLLCVSTIIYIIILILVQCRPLGLFIHQLVHTCYRKRCQPLPDEDEDVTAERQLVFSRPILDYALVVRNLYKFHNARVCAVRNLSFGVDPSECFGLLGVNGAGKTSTFDIITAVAYPTSGMAAIYGTPVDQRPALGYCPQFDALPGSLTGREVMTLIGHFNGLFNVPGRVNKILETIRLEQEADKLIANCSGGQKRRISIGVALMSNAQLIVLDEPTAGVDPSTRHHVWDLLSALRRNGTAILLTTHSMEECEVLCTKVAFMSKGSMIGIGTNQYLKSKFGNSFLLTILPRSPAARVGELLNGQVCETFGAEPLPDNALADFTLSWQIPRRNMPEDRWSAIYRRLDAMIASYESTTAKYDQQDDPAGGTVDYAIRDYSLVQGSMEQVFANLAAK